MKNDLNDKTVLVLDALSATGLAQSLFLRRKGYRTIGLIPPSPAIHKEMPFEPVVTSLSDHDPCQTVQQLFGTVPRIHAVISCPPPFLLAASDELQGDEVRCFLTAHLSQTLELQTLLLEHMLAAGGGNLINIVSGPAHTALTCLGLYRAVQAGICAWSDAASREIASFGVFVSVVESGRVHSDSAKFTLPARPRKRRDHVG